MYFLPNDSQNPAGSSPWNWIIELGNFSITVLTSFSLGLTNTKTISSSLSKFYWILSGTSNSTNLGDFSYLINPSASAPKFEQSNPDSVSFIPQIFV